MRERSKERQRETARQRGVKRDRETEVKGDRDRGQERETREERERGWWLVSGGLVATFCTLEQSNPSLVASGVHTRTRVWKKKKKKKKKRRGKLKNADSGKVIDEKRA